MPECKSRSPSTLSMDEDRFSNKHLKCKITTCSHRDRIVKYTCIILPFSYSQTVPSVTDSNGVILVGVLCSSHIHGDVNSVISNSAELKGHGMSSHSLG